MVDSDGFCVTKCRLWLRCKSAMFRLCSARSLQSTIVFEHSYGRRDDDLATPKRVPQNQKYHQVNCGVPAVQETRCRQKMENVRHHSFEWLPHVQIICKSPNMLSACPNLEQRKLHNLSHACKPQGVPGQRNLCHGS